MSFALDLLFLQGYVADVALLRGLAEAAAASDPARADAVPAASAAATPATTPDWSSQAGCA